MHLAVAGRSEFLRIFRVPSRGQDALAYLDGGGCKTASALTQRCRGNNEGGFFQVDSTATAVLRGMTITGASLGNNGAIDEVRSPRLSRSRTRARTTHRSANRRRI